jgi:hypothetical protein
MEANTPRHNLSIIIAASILAVGLVSSARIIAQRPARVASAAQPVRTVPDLPAPPITQESVKKQVREQVLAAPRVQTLHYDGGVYHLSDAKVAQVTYSVKEDIFVVLLDWEWIPAMLPGGPRQVRIVLENNGYNQYVGSAMLHPPGNDFMESADICVK